MKSADLILLKNNNILNNISVATIMKFRTAA